MTMKDAREQTLAKRVSGSPLAVIFDMDGVLVDSYFAHYESWRRLAAEYDLTVTEDDFIRHFGRTSREIVEAYWGVDRFSTGEITAMDERKEAIFREILHSDFRPMPRIDALLPGLREAGFMLAVGSSGPPENVQMVLEKLAARQLFDAIVTGKDVTRGKPDPQVFLLAAERLGVAPQQCAVVEDAPAGITAAHRARMAAIGLVSTGRTPESLQEADLVVRSLTELNPKIIGDLILKRSQTIAAGKGR